MYEKEVKRKIKESKRIVPEDKLYGPDSAKLKEWKNTAAQYEKGEPRKRYTYNGLVDRYEQVDGYYPHALGFREDIALNHNISFIREVIPDMLDVKEEEARLGKRPPEKVRVLDIGGGLGLYAEQLRKEFGNDIKVVTTGLRKKPVWEFRKRASGINKESARLNQKVFNIPLSLIEEKGPYFDGKLNTRIHPDDLLKRSVLEFKDFEEFDLIIDTASEALYTGKHGKDNLKKYLDAVIKKLRPGGMASISEIRQALTHGRMSEKELNLFLRSKRVKFKKIALTEESDSSEILRIYKERSEK